MKKNQPQTIAVPSEEDSFKRRVLQMHFQQARLTFYLVLGATGLSVLVSIIGVALLLSGQISKGSAIAATGLIPTAVCATLADKAINRLDRLVTEPDDGEDSCSGTET